MTRIAFTRRSVTLPSALSAACGISRFLADDFDGFEGCTSLYQLAGRILAARNAVTIPTTHPVWTYERSTQGTELLGYTTASGHVRVSFRTESGHVVTTIWPPAGGSLDRELLAAGWRAYVPEWVVVETSRLQGLHLWREMQVAMIRSAGARLDRAWSCAGFPAATLVEFQRFADLSRQNLARIDAGEGVPDTLLPDAFTRREGCECLACAGKVFAASQPGMLPLG